jgi:putative ABC transport system permease protein
VKLFDSFVVALRALSANKLRSALTLLGLVVGVSAVIILMSVGRGVQASITSMVSDLGSDVLYVMPGTPGGNPLMASMASMGSIDTLTWEDAQAIERSPDAPSVETVASMAVTLVEVVSGRENMLIELDGVTPNFIDVINYDIDQGIPFDQGHMRSRANVVLLGYKVAETLFEDSDPLGQHVKINGIKFRVIGILEKKGSVLGQSQDEVVLMPLTTALARITRGLTPQGQHVISSMLIKADGTDEVEAAKEQVTDILRKRHRLQEDDDDDFNISSMEEILAIVGTITGVMTMFLASIAGVSLVVGGIGVMNIMLVSVKDRTREIGIRRAVGAKRRDILMQFLIESATLSLSGGMVGLAIGWGVAALITALGRDFGISAVISPDIVVLAFSVAVAVGLFSGIYPATRAARLDPIEALRYE